MLGGKESKCGMPIYKKVVYAPTSPTIIKVFKNRQNYRLKMPCIWHVLVISKVIIFLPVILS